MDEAESKPSSVLERLASVSLDCQDVILVSEEPHLGAVEMTTDPETLFWSLAAELQRDDPRLQEGTIMSGRCLRVGPEFLALVDYKGSGLVVKLPKRRVAELIETGEGRAFGPAGKVFREWVAIPVPDRERWRALLLEGITFVGAAVSGA